MQRLDPSDNSGIAETDCMDWPEATVIKGMEVADGAVDEDEGGETSQMYHTLTWLTENYERQDGVCVPRCVLYKHYLQLCHQYGYTPAGAASFGKIIRQRFPNLTTRRLGTRGQSKYHYYGIGIKETSVYYHSVYTGRGLTRFSDTKVKHEGSNRKYSLSSKAGTLLPNFPEVDNLILPAALDVEKVRIFLMMYSKHSQRILDTTISANFTEIPNLLLHFWQGMPDHLMPLLDHDVIAQVIAFCDVMLYETLIDVLIPNTIQELPEKLCRDVLSFARCLPRWVTATLDSVPAHIADHKLKVARVFMRAIRRHISFIQLAQTARVPLSSPDLTTAMLADLSRADLSRLLTQTTYSCTPITTQLTEQYLGELRSLLGRQATVEEFTEWLDEMVDTHVLQPCHNSLESFRERAAEFLLQWTSVSALVTRELTLAGANSFSACHVVCLLLGEYVTLIMDTHHSTIWERGLKDDMQQLLKDAVVATEETKVGTKLSSSDRISSAVHNGRKRHINDTLIDLKQMKIQSPQKVKVTLPSPTKEAAILEYAAAPSINCDMNLTGPREDPVKPSSGGERVPSLHGPLLAPSHVKGFVPSHSSLEHHSYINHLSPPNSYHIDNKSPQVSLPGSGHQMAARACDLSDTHAQHSKPHAHQHTIPQSSFLASGSNVTSCMQPPSGYSTAYYRGESPWNPDHLPGYASCYAKLPAIYETYPGAAPLLTSAPGYQDSYPRAVFDPPVWGYYPHTGQDSNIVTDTGHFRPYGSNFLNIAHAHLNQYGCQEVMYSHLQEDYFSGNFRQGQLTPCLTNPFASPFR